MAPFYEFGRFGEHTSLLVAVMLGIGFGWFLERGGMGNARKLAGQFYLTDLSVLKLMFSAILTAMLGLFWLSWAGLLDLSRVYVPETFILPQLLGGVVFGVGFAMGGLCPGTSCVAAVTGRQDGLALIGGLLAGVFVFGELFPFSQPFAEATARGEWTLPQALGLTHGTVVGIIVAAALGAFAGAEWLERRAERPAAPAGAERGLLIAAVVGGGLAVIAGVPARPTLGSVDVQRLAEIVEHEEDHVTAIELAKWIRDDHAGLRVLDIRSDSEFREFHIPGAKNVALTELARMSLDSTATYVLYSEGGTHAAQAWFLLRARSVENVYFLRGGLYEWLEQVMNPRLDPDASQAERDSLLALARWFGGKVQVGPPPKSVPSILDGALAPPSANATRESIRQIRRRAC